MGPFGLEPVPATCPYCSSRIEILIDCSMAEQRYLEDCPTCHRAMHVHTMVSADDIASLEVRHHPGS
jgi:transposase-like protein